MPELYELTEEYKQLLEMMLDPEIDVDTVKDTLEGVEGEIAEEVDNLITTIKTLEPIKDMYEKEEERIAGNKRRVNNCIKMAKGKIMALLEAIPDKKLETAHYRTSLAKNGGVTPIKVTGDVPPMYRKNEPDMKLIREAMDAGIVLEFAEWGERGRRLMIK